MPQSSPLWPSLRGAIPHYVAAVLAVAAAVVAGLLVDRFLQSAPFVSLFLCAILLAVWLGGLGPGLLAIGLSILAFEYFFISPMHPMAFGVQGGLRLALFAVAALFAVWVSVAQKRTAESLRRARDDLRATVAELRRSETYLAEAQRLSNTGSFGWTVLTRSSGLKKPIGSWDSTSRLGRQSPAPGTSPS